MIAGIEVADIFALFANIARIAGAVIGTPSGIAGGSLRTAG